MDGAQHNHTDIPDTHASTPGGAYLCAVLLPQPSPSTAVAQCCSAWTLTRGLATYTCR